MENLTMTTINTTVTRDREIERVVTVIETEEVSGPVDVAVIEGRRGGAVITLNGEKALVITRSGHLRRLRGLTEAAGVRRLPDGRIAIKKAAAGS
ncbi:hypothetical protein [Falsiroseomonas sp. CW058]|uniref:hypothetical protein n=1 Tax=Falsiroseomonas sp. CW058 TaxID=3388664 RepID=UPI003D31FB65